MRSGCETMCSTANNAELRTTRKYRGVFCSSSGGAPRRRNTQARGATGPGWAGGCALTEGERRRDALSPPPQSASVFVFVFVFLVAWCDPHVASPSRSPRPDPDPGAEDQAPPVSGGPGGMRDVERGLLPGRSLVRLVHGTRDRLGGGLAPRLRVGHMPPPFFKFLLQCLIQTSRDPSCSSVCLFFSSQTGGSDTGAVFLLGWE